MKYGTILMLVLLVFFPAGQPAAEVSKPPVVSAGSGTDESVIRMLSSIAELRKNLQQRISERKAMLAQTTSDSLRVSLEAEISKLDRQLDDATSDFERIATGVDIGLFLGKKEETFNWKEEVMALVEPGIKEIKRMTVNARNRTKLKDEAAYYENLASVSREAVKNIQTLMGRAEDKQLRKHLEALLPEWKSIEKQTLNKLQIADMQLAEMDRNEKSLIETSRLSIKQFFRTRGLYLMIALLSCISAVMVLRLAAGLVRRLIPGYGLPYKPFHIRLFDILARLITLAATLFVLVLVFYIFEDWVLLSLSIVFFLGLGWAVKNALPRYWQQSRLMLNIGSVREGERMVYEGVPWLVKSINVFSILENPDMGVTLRLPIEELLGKVSRPFRPDEPWFPCRRDDWVVLADGTWARVRSISHEMVSLIQGCGSLKTYQTGDFLAQTPLNISRDFTLRVGFGISYNIQKDATGKVLDLLAAYIREAVRRDGYEQGLLNLQVEFMAAGASSLDLAVIADFKGEMASRYFKLSRAIQRWCVDACTLNGWEIPFPQLTVHRPE